MKKLLFFIFMMLGLVAYGQAPVILSKQTTRPSAPTTGAKLYDYFHHVELRDSVGYTWVLTGRDTLNFLHSADVTVSYDIRTATLWQTSTHYTLNDVVSFVDASLTSHYYLCKLTHNSTGSGPTDSDGVKWKELFYFPGRSKYLQDSTAAGTVGWYLRDTLGATQKAIHAYLAANHYSKTEANGLLSAKLDTTKATLAMRNSWTLAASHKTTEDALSGLVKVNGAGSYSAITDNSINWNAAILIELDPVHLAWLARDPLPDFARNLGSAASADLIQLVLPARTLTINGTAQDLSADRTWTIAPMVYPGAGIALSTGSAWGTPIADASANWNNAYTYRLTSASGTAPLTLTLASNGLTGSVAAGTTVAAGTMSAADKIKLDGIAAGATLNNAEDVSYKFGSAALADLKNFVPVLPNGATTFNKIDYIWPSADGTSGYVLSTNGAGVFTWIDKTGGVAGSIKSINGSSKTNQTIAGYPWNFVESGDSSSIHTLTIPPAASGNNGYMTGAYVDAIALNTAKVSFPGFGTDHTHSAYGDHTHDFSGSFAALSHAHGNITNAGLIGTTANLPIITGAGGILQVGSFGTGANTFAQGNDSRFHDQNATNSLYSGLVTNATHSGDATGATALTLATVNSNIGTYNNITINAKGLATAGSNVAYLTSETDPIHVAWLLTDPVSDFARDLGSSAFTNIDAFATYNHIHDYTSIFAPIAGTTYVGTTAIALNRASAAQSLTGITSIDGSAVSLKSPATTGLVHITGMGAGQTRVKTVRDVNDQLLELGGSYTPTGNWNWASATVTWPTFNQNTTGTAAGLTAQYIDWNASTGGTSIANKPTTMTPTSHMHGNITNAGLIGSTAYLPIITGTGGLLQAGSFGTGANTFAQGNDSRFHGVNDANSLYSPLVAVQAPNVVYAGPTPNGGLPSFRLLAAADIPALSYAATNQTMYIGTTGVAINRASGALTLAGITLTTPFLGTPVAGDFSTGTFTWPKIPTSGTADALAAQYINWSASSGATSIANKPTISNLTVQSLSGTSITWNVTNGVNGILTATGATTITMSNLGYGTSGNLTIQSSSVQQIYFYGYTFKLSPSIYFSSAIVLTSGSNKIDVYSWYYDGVTVFINGTMNYQ